MCNPKFPHNIGAAIRACSCYDVEQVWITGQRLAKKVWESKRIPREERMRGYQNVSLILEEKPFKFFPKDVVPVAIELTRGAENLLQFEHPEKAVYVFGPEDGSIPTGIQRMCHRRVFIPTKHCVNLSAAIYTILYDRTYKNYLKEEVMPLPMDQTLREQKGWPEKEFPLFESYS